MKRPSFQFYPSDWRKDTALQFCSLAAQGLWINLICIAHECEPYGHLMINGKPMDNQSIGRIVGLSAKECKKLLDELFDAGVCSVNDQGVIFSRRMIRDEEIRNKRAQGGKDGAEHGAKGAAHGVKGGRPTANKGGIKNPPSDSAEEPPIKPPPSSSSSSSNTVITHSSEDTTIPDATPIAAACIAIREVYDQYRKPPTDISQANPTLQVLIAAGATADEFREAAIAAMQADPPKGFAWIIGRVKGQRREAASLPDLSKPPIKGAINGREMARNIAASSVFTPETTQHLRGNPQQPRNEIEVNE